MNSDILSQEEIEALLKGEHSDAKSEKVEGEVEGESSNGDMEMPAYDYSDMLSEVERDAIGEIGNISMGTSATTLSTLLNKKVSITTPNVYVTTPQEMAADHPLPFVAVDVSWQIGLQGSNLMLLNSDDVKIIADLMMGKTDGFDTTREITEIDLSAVSEAMNQMMGSTSTSLSEMFHKKVDISPPSSMEVTFEEGCEILEVLKSKEPIICISFRMVVEDLIDSNFVQLIPVSFGKEMVSYLIGAAVPEENEMSSVASLKEKQNTQSSNFSDTSSTIAATQMNHTKSQTESSYQQTQSTSAHSRPLQEPVVVRQPEFSTFDESSQVQRIETIDLVGDIPVELTVELGRASKKIGEILGFTQGTVIELNRLVGESLDIFANGKYIAKGEVVVIDDNFGIRVTDIESVRKNLL